MEIVRSRKICKNLCTVPGFPLEIAGFVIPLQNKRQSVRHNDHAALAVARGSTGTAVRSTHVFAFFANVPIHDQSQSRLHACATENGGIFETKCLFSTVFVLFLSSQVTRRGIFPRCCSECLN